MVKLMYHCGLTHFEIHFVFFYQIVIMSSTCDSLIDDIEDMVSADDPTPQERQYARKSIIPRARKRNTQQTTEVLHADRYG